MKKTLLVTLALASIFAFASCASKSAADTAAAEPAVNEAKEAAMAEEGAIDISTYGSKDKWATKFKEDEWTVTMNGGESFYFPLPKELNANETIVVHLTGVNGGKAGFRTWTIDDHETTNSNIITDYAFEALPQGDFDVTYELTATAPSTSILIKGPVWGTMLEKLTIKSCAVIYK